jgi:hypothetical protein
MKTKEEIEQLAFKNYGDTLLKGSFIHGYTQCQEDTAAKFTQLKEAINKHIWYDEDGFPQVNLYAIENYLLD